MWYITKLKSVLKFYGVVVALLFGSCKDEDTRTKPILFELVEASHSSIDFTNKLTEDEEFNIIEYLYFYNGGGVAVGDINNDGLVDLYFTGNQQSNRLYLNKGDFRFEDITDKSGAGGSGNWKTGVSMADVNGDGLLDIYVCGVGQYKNFNGFNQLFINNGDLTFTERSKEYGLDFQGFSTQSVFFDYDRDGDLDMYLLNHSVHTQRSYGRVSLRNDVDTLAGDRLYKNHHQETGSPFFTDVTRAAGIYSSQIGYGLGVGVADVNLDGFPDIYVSNDFVENDYLYINNRDGTFSQQIENVISHTSRFSMGNDLADINNDGWPDIITTDMLPQDESVIKTSAGEDSYEMYAFKLKYGYHKQVSRNALQINRGVADSGELVFTDVAQAAGVEATDWSWAPLLVDFDGDGLKDLFISNGIVRRPNDLDYINFISDDSVQQADDVLGWVQKMPEGKVSNYIFKNIDGLTFQDRTKEWGLSIPSFSNGAAYADLDNDGDPDLIVNRINDTPLVYRNNSPSGRFLKVKLQGISGNFFSVGAKITVTQEAVMQTQEVYPSRGWYSSSDVSCMFGLLDQNKVVSIQVVWPDGKVSVQEFMGNHISIAYSEDLPLYAPAPEVHASLLKNSTSLDFKHQEDEFNAFNREGLIPHMLTTEGPPMAVADVNGDLLDDIFIGGAKGQSGALFIHLKSGGFSQLAIPDIENDRLSEDTGAAFFDADGDGDQDLIVVSGGQEESKPSDVLRPRLYLNDGKGRYIRSVESIPSIFLHASCVNPADFDQDGDVDLFIGSSVLPMLYGMSPMSYLLVNDGTGKFSIDTTWLGSSQFDNPTRVRPGMVKDAVWVDLNKDGLLDLVLVGEWMPITILLQQDNHKFRNVTNEYGLENTSGWWKSIVVGDFDNDGDMDLVGGNHGLNSRLRATTEKPLRMYLGDFDSNGGSDHILVYYNGDINYPFTSRDQLVKQLPMLKKKFLSYRNYRDVKLEDIVTPQKRGNSAEMVANNFASVYLENNEQSFKVKALPFEAQLFPVFALKAEDIDGNGTLDLLLGGNLNAVQPEIGPMDAGIGLVLLGDGIGNFKPLTLKESGFLVRGEAREIVTLKNLKNERILFVSRNNDTVLSFTIKK